MKYAIVIEKTDTGFSGYVPDMPGIGVAGETRAQVRKLLREAAIIYAAEKRARVRVPRGRQLWLNMLKRLDRMQS